MLFYWDSLVRDGLVFHIGNINQYGDILLFLCLWWPFEPQRRPLHHHFEEGVVVVGAACDFLDRTSSGYWGLHFPQGDARPNQSFVSVGDSGQRFKQDCKFHTQSVTLFSSGKLPVVVELLSSIAHRCRDFPWPDRRRLIDVGVLGQTCADSKDHQD